MNPRRVRRRPFGEGRMPEPRAASLPPLALDGRRAVLVRVGARPWTPASRWRRRQVW